jgi:hypothetical protein
VLRPVAELGEDFRGVLAEPGQVPGSGPADRAGTGSAAGHPRERPGRASAGAVAAGAPPPRRCPAPPLRQPGLAQPLQPQRGRPAGDMPQDDLLQKVPVTPTVLAASRLPAARSGSHLLPCSARRETQRRRGEAHDLQASPGPAPFRRRASALVAVAQRRLPLKPRPPGRSRAWAGICRCGYHMVSAMPGSIWFFMTRLLGYGLQLPQAFLAVWPDCGSCCRPAVRVAG